VNHETAGKKKKRADDGEDCQPKKKKKASGGARAPRISSKKIFGALTDRAPCAQAGLAAWAKARSQWQPTWWRVRSPTNGIASQQCLTFHNECSPKTAQFRAQRVQSRRSSQRPRLVSSQAVRFENKRLI